MPLKYFFKTEFPKISGGSVKVSQCTSCTIDYNKTNKLELYIKQYF